MSAEQRPSIADLVTEAAILGAPDTPEGYRLVLSDGRDILLPKEIDGATLDRGQYLELVLGTGRIGPFEFKTLGGRKYEAMLAWDPEYTFRDSVRGHPIGWHYFLFPPYE